MSYLLDSNILLRIARPSDPDYTLVRTALQKLSARGELRTYLSQNLIEFWNVCTRPSTARGGFGFTIAEAERAAKRIERLFILLPDTPAIHTEWRRLVFTYNVQGVKVHDARLVAGMNAHGLTHILTLNPSDFSRYPGITAVHPGSI
jgi:predicted nucleic acid-binding protein